MIAKTPWAKNKDREKLLAEHKVFVTAMAKKAQECLIDPKFDEYRKMFIQYKEEVIESIILLNETDPVIYGFKVRQLVDTLKAYRLLISSVEEDATRKVE